MTNQQHPDQFDWATELLDAQGHVTLSAKEVHEIGARLLRLYAESEMRRTALLDEMQKAARQHAENETLHAKIKVYEDLDEAASDVQLLRMGYAAARLEIESLQARIKTMAEEHADELMVAHLDGRMRAAKVMPESIRSILVRCRNFIDTTKVPAYPAGADLADEIDVLLAAQPAGEYPALPKPGRRGPAGTGSYFDSFTADQMRAYVDADRAMRAAQPAGAQQPGVATWTPLPGTLPEPGKPVLLDIGKEYPIRAMWAAKHTLEVGVEDDSGFGEYDEATGTYYCPEGWYEWNEHEEIHWAVNKTPTAWCELPPNGGASHGQAPAQAAPVCGSPADLPPLPDPDLRDVGTKPEDIKTFLRGYATEYAKAALAARAPADSVLEDAARLEFEMQHGSAIAAARKQGARHEPPRPQHGYFGQASINVWTSLAWPVAEIASSEYRAAHSPNTTVAVAAY